MREIKRITEPLNRAETQEIFIEYAIVLEHKDVLPASTAVELFGQDVTDEIWRTHKTGEYINVFSLPSGESLDYFYKAGFLALVTYHNVKAMSKGNRAGKKA